MKITSAILARLRNQKVKLSLIAIVGRVKHGELADIGASPAKKAGRGHDSTTDLCGGETGKDKPSLYVSNARAILEDAVSITAQYDQRHLSHELASTVTRFLRSSLRPFVPTPSHRRLPRPSCPPQSHPQSRPPSVAAGQGGFGRQQRTRYSRH